MIDGSFEIEASLEIRSSVNLVQNELNSIHGSMMQRLSFAIARAESGSTSFYRRFLATVLIELEIDSCFQSACVVNRIEWLSGKHPVSRVIPPAWISRDAFVIHKWAYSQSSNEHVSILSKPDVLILLLNVYRDLGDFLSSQCYICLHITLRHQLVYSRVV